MAGLDNIKGYAEGEEVTPSEGALPVKMGPKGNVAVSGPVYMDPDSSAQMLKNMEAFLEERNSPWREFNRGLERMSAWAVPSLEGGKALALNKINERQNAEDEMRLQKQNEMATIRAALAQQQQTGQSFMDALSRQSSAGGAGGAAGAGGPGIDPMLMNEIQRLAANPATRAQAQQLYQKALSDNAALANKAYFDAANNTSQTYNINGREVNMTPNEYRARFGGRGAQQITNNPPMTAPVSGDAASRVAARESGTNPNVGFHDLTKGTAYGTYGITDAAYKDVQAANPTFKGRVISSLKPEEQTEAFNTYRGLAQNQLTKLGVEPTAQNLDLAHFLGPTGAANYLKTGSISPEAATSNGGVAKTNQIAQGILAGQNMPVSRQTAGTQEFPPSLEDIKEKRGIESAALKTELEAKGKDITARNSATMESYKNADTNLANIKYVNNLVSTNPRAFGVLQHPNVVSAIGTMLEGGTTVPGAGTASVKNIDDAVRKAMKGSTEAEIVAAQKAANKFSELQLNAAKVVLKGQGAVSDNERELVARMTGSTKNSPAAIRDFLAWTEMRSAYDKQVGEALDAWESANPNQSYRKFELTPEYKALKTAYAQQINEFADKAGNYKASEGAITKPTGYDAWKKSQGKS